MGDSMKAAADWYDEQDRKRKKKQKEDLKDKGGCWQSEDGIHCGHLRPELGQDVVRCCFCDSTASVTTWQEKVGKYGHGKYEFTYVPVIVFNQPKVWKMGDK